MSKNPTAPSPRHSKTQASKLGPNEALNGSTLSPLEVFLCPKKVFPLTLKAVGNSPLDGLITVFLMLLPPISSFNYTPQPFLPINIGSSRERGNAFLFFETGKTHRQTDRQIQVHWYRLTVAQHPLVKGKE